MRCGRFAPTAARGHLSSRRKADAPRTATLRIGSKQSHLTFGIAAVGAMRVGFDEFADSKTIRGLLRRDGDVSAHCSLPDAKQRRTVALLRTSHHIFQRLTACNLSVRKTPMASSALAEAFNFPTLPGNPCAIPIHRCSLVSTPAATARSI
jgi:hypothetical protein